MYEYHNHQLSIPARLLYEDWNLMSYKNYNVSCVRGKLVRTKEGRGAGNEAWLSFKDLPQDIRQIAIDRLGDPKEIAVRNQLLSYILPDRSAFLFFADHRRPNGKPLTFEKQRELSTNCNILKAVQTVINDSPLSKKVFGSKKVKIWQNISEAVNLIPTKDHPHTLPGNWRRLQQKFNAWLAQGPAVFISAAEGNENSAKIKGDVADFLLAHYSLPIKMSIPMLLQKYEQQRHNSDWPALSDSGVTRWLYLPEQERVWIQARDGKDAWRRKYGNSISRDKSRWFPNVYWAIDGSKLDWIHYDDDAGNKRAAKLKINPLVDVYSEKILGWSFSETESHIDHIKAVSMALNNAQCRPYLITYDQQSGHKMSRMQQLYTNIVARDGGAHYPHKAGQKSNPMEQLFARLQQQVANMWWWSDKQSIKARASRSQMNQEFIAANTHNLHTREDLAKAWEVTVKQWNEAEHPLFRGQSRNQVYDHAMELRDEISPLEIAAAVWVDQTKEITYKRDGITMRLADSKFTFEVYDHNGDIDLEFRRTGIGKRYTIRYNPEYLDSYVQLYEVTPEGESIFAACAQPKRKHESVPALMTDGDKAAWWKDFETQEIEYKRDRSHYEALVARTGISREAMIEEQDLLMKMSGVITKKERTHAETEYDF